MIAAHQLLFAFRQVEGQPPGFGKRGHDEHHEAQRLQQHEPTVLRLGLHEIIQPQRTAGQDDAQQGQAHG